LAVADYHAATNTAMPSRCGTPPRVRTPRLTVCVAALGLAARARETAPLLLLTFSVFTLLVYALATQLPRAPFTGHTHYAVAAHPAGRVQFTSTLRDARVGKLPTRIRWLLRFTTCVLPAAYLPPRTYRWLRCCYLPLRMKTRNMSPPTLDCFTAARFFDFLTTVHILTRSFPRVLNARLGGLL